MTTLSDSLTVDEPSTRSATVGEWNVVTGAFGYSGKYITRRLLAQGHRVRTLTNHPNRPNPFGDQVTAAPFNFDNRDELVKSLQGATALFNTYWVRFPHGTATYDRAVENTITLLRAAEEAGVRRIVHISIANPSEDSPLPYYRGKALLEKAIMQSRMSYAILRPTVIFGDEDILINNIAYLLRRYPIFVVPGSGEYRIQPIFVEDLAELAVRAASDVGQVSNLQAMPSATSAGLETCPTTNSVIDAVGPEIYTFDELLRLIAATVGRSAKLIHVPPWIALVMSRLIGWLLHDVLLTRDEMHGLMADLLVSSSTPTGQTRLSDWLARNADRVGTCYASELGRHY